MMFHGPILCIPRTEAVRRAGDYLLEAGFHITRTPAPDISHVLLPVPSFSAGDEYLAHFLADLPDDVIISGGNLSSPLLEGYATIDFLKDPYYLAENAAITASCTLKISKNKLGTSVKSKQILIIGWGRIGKCLCRLFENEGASVTVAARKDSDRAIISVLGNRSISINEAAAKTEEFDIIINTVPAMVLPEIKCKEDALLLELASKPGMSGKNILDCRGLPSKIDPDASGRLIAKTFCRLAFGQEVSV